LRRTASFGVLNVKIGLKTSRRTKKV